MSDGARALEQATRLAAVATLLPVGFGAMVSFASSESKGRQEDDEEAGKRDVGLVGGSICLVAAAFYCLMGASSSERSRTALRSLDWLATCPLLVLEMFTLLDASGGGAAGAAAASPRLLGLALVAVVAMVLAGWRGDGRLPPARLAAGFACLLVVAACLAAQHARRGGGDRKARRRAQLVAAFFAVWPLYGLVATLRCCGRLGELQAGGAYNLLDVASKAVFVLGALVVGLSNRAARRGTLVAAIRHGAASSARSATRATRGES